MVELLKTRINKEKNRAIFGYSCINSSLIRLHIRSNLPPKRYTKIPIKIFKSIKLIYKLFDILLINHREQNTLVSNVNFNKLRLQPYINIEDSIANDTRTHSPINKYHCFAHIF